MGETFEDRVSLTEHATRYIKQRVSDISPTLDSDDDPASEGNITKLKPTFLTSIVAGGIAGVVVDISLYPLDTIKTRLQSKEGFRASGGFKGIYNGILPVLLGSAPISALFFATYNTTVNTLKTKNDSLNPLVYLVAASCAETVTSFFRVPIEIIKQRNQISNIKSSYIIRKTFKKEGFYGFYRGFSSTLLREIPFAAVQYPLWEYMINQFIIYQNGKELTALQTAYCGAIAGAIAAATTTPLDVVKTRIMLAEKEKIDRYKKNLNYFMAREVYRDRGIRGLFAGAVPRVLWIMLGGFIYFGAYEKAKILCERKWEIITKEEQGFKNIAPSYLEEQFDACAFCISEDSKVESNAEKIAEDSNAVLENQKIIDATLLQPSDDSMKTK